MAVLKTLVIVNPISGTGSKADIARQLKKHLPATAFDYQLKFTEAPKHATELARNAAEENLDAVLAVGGDGTVNETARGLLHSTTALGIIPTGSGNGLGRHLKIPSNTVAALQVLQQSSIMAADVLTANDQPFFNVAGVGYDAFVAGEFAKSKTRGMASYTQIVFSSWLSYLPRKYQLFLDGKELETEALMISVANGSQFGNNARIAPQAILNDGEMDVAIMQKFPLMAVPLLAGQLFTGELLQSRYTAYHRAKELVVRKKEDLIHLDGEPYEMKGEVNFKVLPQALNILVPKAFFDE